MADLTSTRVFGKLTVLNAAVFKDNLNVIGDIVANALSGDGTNLTNVDAATLDGLDSSNFLRSDVADYANGRIQFKAAAHTGGIATVGVGGGGLEVYTNGAPAAIMAFHRGGSHGAYFGLDDDDKFKVGGWSMGSVAHEIWHAGNFDPATKAAASHTHSYVPTSRTVNGKALSSNISLTAADVGALGSGAKAADANLLDGIDSSGFLRSNAADVKTSGALTFNDNIYLYFGTGNDARFWTNGSHLYTDLNAGIGNWYIRDGSTTRFTFDDAGHFTATGNVTAYSDERLKKNWRELPTHFIEQLAMVKHGIYDRKDIEATQVGVSAQSLQNVLPEAVIEEDDKFSVAYGNAALTAAVALAQRVVDLENRIKTLEATT